MPEEKAAIGIIILAAGASTRLGTPKQLLVYGPSSLLNHAILQATGLTYPVFVVTGASHQQVSASIKTAGVTTVFNPHWETGMASSIHAGLNALLAHNRRIQGALIMVCDQPLITDVHLRQLCETFHREHLIVATSYQKKVGVPAVFPKSAFHELFKLTGDEGARQLIRTNKTGVIGIPFEGGNLDIDTMEDYHKIANLN